MLNPVFDKQMKSLTSMKTGGIANKAYFPESENELLDIIKKLRDEKEKYIVVGNMSNVLLPDERIEACLIVTTGMKQYSVSNDSDETVTVYAQSGVSLTKLAYEMCKNGYSGMECLYGIPGTVGGAVYMNAGAYGGEIKDALCEARVLCNDGQIREFSRDECELSYRSSAFQKTGGVILGAYLLLTKKDADECVRTAKEFMQRRIDKQPLEYASCGSTFKRPEGYFAGALIEEAGLKGFNVNGAEVSEKHAGFVINKGSACTNDVLFLMREIRRIVKEKSGVTLQAEIQLLNKDGEFFTL